MTSDRSAVGRSKPAGILLRCSVAIVVLAAAVPSVASTLSDCEQDDVASKAIRACTMILSGSDLVAAERGRIYTLRGVAWMTEDDPAAAAEDFTQAIEIDPKNIRALTRRAKSYSLLGKHQLAVEDWGRLLEIKPDSEEYFRYRGASQLAAGDTAAAFADFDKAIAIQPKNMEAYIGRALVFEKLGDRANVLAEFDKALELDRTYIPTYWEKGQVAERWGDDALAIETYSTLLRYNGVYSHARKRLQKLGILHPP